MIARLFCRLVLAVGIALAIASPASADVPASRHRSFEAPSFDELPRLDPKATLGLNSADRAKPECVALCEFAATVDADPFGYGSTPRPFDGRPTPFGRQYQYANANPTFFTDPTGNYSWNDLKGEAGWYRDAAGAFGRDISENAGTRLGNIGRATVEQAKALPGAVVDGAQETLARVHDVGVLASGSGGPLLSNVGQRSSDVLAGGGSLADLTQTIGSEQGKFASELIANIYTGGGYNVAKESYLALQGNAAQAETRLNQAAGSAVLAATIGGAVKAAPVVVAEARSALASSRAFIGRLEFGVTPGGPAMVSLPTVRLRAPKSAATENTWTYRQRSGAAYDQWVNETYYGGNPAKKPFFRSEGTGRYLDNLSVDGTGVRTGIENKYFKLKPGTQDVNVGVRRGTALRRELADTLRRAIGQARVDRRLLESVAVDRFEWNLSGNYPKFQRWLEHLGLDVNVRPKL